MTYGEAYDEALRKIARLEETNGALCAEINRQERVIERQRADIERQDEYRQRIVGDVNRLSKSLGVKITGTDDEIIARDIEAVAALKEQVRARGAGECEWQHLKSGTLYDVWRCSVCGYEYVDSRCDVHATELDPNYCPKCGKAVKR